MFCLYFLQMKLQINLIWSNKEKQNTKQTPIKTKPNQKPINYIKHIDQSQLMQHWFLRAFIME